MPTASYEERRSQVEAYFGGAAAQNWSRLTSEAPVGRIRATVRAGRERMRLELLSWLPDDLRGARLLDAGCGTGVLAVELARRGGKVLAIDLSPTLIGLGRQRAPQELGAGRVEFRVGDMLDESLGDFDFVIAMDSLIHYTTRDAVHALSALAARTTEAVLFTFAPSTPALVVMHAVGRCFPRRNRAPAIEPVDERLIRRLLAAEPELRRWRVSRSGLIASGFYTSQALELIPA
jgi:magnesium-protoporphyrin O-methyltransferase